MARPVSKQQWTAVQQRGDDSSSDESPTPSQSGSVSPDPQSHHPHGTSAFKSNPTKVTSTFDVDDSRTNTDKEDQIPLYRRQTRSQRFYGGLKRNLRMYAVAAVVVLIINIAWLIYARTHYGIHSGSGGFEYGTISTGSCESTKLTNTFLHLVINVMSTALLSGSNAFMAAFSGPTRDEVDKAHAKRTWLHVQSVSLRNLRVIAKRKTFVVSLLVLSSVPFHLLFNSVIYSSIAANNYYWLVTTEGFLNGSSYNLTGPPSYAGGEMRFNLNVTLPNDSPFNSASNNTAATDQLYQYFDNIQASAKQWTRMDPHDCIYNYEDFFQGSLRNVVVVTSTQNTSNSVLRFGSADLDPRQHTIIYQNFWICSNEYEGYTAYANNSVTCDPFKIRDDIDHDRSPWILYNNTVEYCLSEPVDSACDVRFSLDLMIILLSFNILKIVAMAWILLRLDAEKILTSVGDAAASFLQHPDRSTLGMCLANKEHIKSFWSSPGVAKVYNEDAHRRWGQALSKWRWIIFSSILAGSLGAMTYFCVWGFTSIENRGVTLFDTGFGQTNQFAMVLAGGGGNALTNALIANLPQIVLAMMYLVYQGIVTAMFIAADWAQLAFAPQPLMVSSPVGKQRGVWAFGAPPLPGAILLILQTVLHWFVSQSLFVVDVIIYDKVGNRDAFAPSYSNIGYSPWPMLSTVLACIALFSTAVYFQARSLPKGAPPVVATCTAAISAACHVPDALIADSLSFEPLRWGVTEQAPDGIGHCSLGPAECWEDGRASRPVNGVAYCGLEKEKAE